MAAKKRVSHARKGATSRPAKSGKSRKPAKSAKSASPGRIAQLEAMVGKLRASLVAEAKRRKLDQRVLAEAKRARDAVGKQISALRLQGSKLAAQIKRAAHENRTLEQARRTALAKVEELRAELHGKAKRCVAPRPSWRSSPASRPRARGKSCTAAASGWSRIMIPTWKACTRKIRSRTIRSPAKNRRSSRSK